MVERETKQKGHIGLFVDLKTFLKDDFLKDRNVIFSPSIFLSLFFVKSGYYDFSECFSNDKEFFQIKTKFWCST